MTPAQTKAAEFLRKFVERQLNDVAERGDTITAFETREYETFVSVWATTDMLGLPVTNLLRDVSRQTWQFFIGKRGGVTVSMCPQSFYQFYGKRAFGMVFKPSEAKTRTRYAA